MKELKKEPSKKDNSLKYFIKLILIALFFLGVGIVFITYIIRLLFKI